MLEILSWRLLVAEGGFEATLSLVNPAKKGQINGINVLMLIDTLASNSFITQRCAERVKVEVADTALSVKINFAKWSCQAAQVRTRMRFKASGAKFKENFTICGLDGVNLVSRNMILDYYGVEVKQKT